MTSFTGRSTRLRPHYDRLLSSGLYDDLCGRHLLVPHIEVPAALAAEPGAYRVIRPEGVPFVSYSYEWCFSQLRDAAMATLEIQRLALARGMTLKDASARNIQFLHGRPILIDTLSFEELRAGAVAGLPAVLPAFLRPTATHEQHRRAALKSTPRTLGWPAARPRDQASSQSFVASILNPTPRTPPRPQYKEAAHTSLKTRGDISVSHKALLGLVDSLETAISRLRWQPVNTPWGDYQWTHNYSPQALQGKTYTVRELLERSAPKSVWDTDQYRDFQPGCSGGWGMGVVLDGDAGAVEVNYRLTKERGELRLCRF